MPSASTQPAAATAFQKSPRPMRRHGRGRCFHSPKRLVRFMRGNPTAVETPPVGLENKMMKQPFWLRHPCGLQTLDFPQRVKHIPLAMKFWIAQGMFGAVPCSVAEITNDLEGCVTQSPSGPVDSPLGSLETEDGRLGVPSHCLKWVLNCFECARSEEFWHGVVARDHSLWPGAVVRPMLALASSLLCKILQYHSISFNIYKFMPFYT